KSRSRAPRSHPEATLAGDSQARSWMFSSSHSTPLPVRRHLHLIAFDAHGITADLDARVVGPGTVRQSEAPGVPRTRDDATVEVAVAQGRSHVGTAIVDGKDVPPIKEYCYQLL